MKWISALAMGCLFGVMVPMLFGGRDGIWQDSWAGMWTIRPIADSPGLLFSIPVAIGAAIALRLFFSWHSD